MHILQVIQVMCVISLLSISLTYINVKNKEICNLNKRKLYWYRKSLSMKWNPETQKSITASIVLTMVQSRRQHITTKCYLSNVFSSSSKSFTIGPDMLNLLLLPSVYQNAKNTLSVPTEMLTLFRRALNFLSVSFPFLVFLLSLPPPRLP